MANAFRGEFQFLSNFYEEPVIIHAKDNSEPLVFRCAEAAFQAAKLDPNDPKTPEYRAMFLDMTGAEAKKAGGRYGFIGKNNLLRPNWNEKRISAMTYILRCKFAPGTPLAKRLQATGNMPLAEENSHGDTFWGTVNGKGENYLGKLLMQIRDELNSLTPGRTANLPDENKSAENPATQNNGIKVEL